MPRVDALRYFKMGGSTPGSTTIQIFRRTRQPSIVAIRLANLVGFHDANSLFESLVFGLERRRLDGTIRHSLGNLIQECVVFGVSRRLKAMGTQAAIVWLRDMLSREIPTLAIDVFHLADIVMIVALVESAIRNRSWAMRPHTVPLCARRYPRPLLNPVGIILSGNLVDGLENVLMRLTDLRLENRA